MEGIEGGGVGVGGGGYCWWAVASTTQLAWGINSYRKGCDSRLMPFKAFAVASLFVGAMATATVGIFRASGIRSVGDAKEVGASIRTGLGVPPRARDE